MKVRWYDRVLFVCLALVLLCVAVGSFALLAGSLRNGIVSALSSMSASPTGQAVLAGCGAICLILLAYCVYEAFSRKKRHAAPKSVLVSYNEAGMVEVTLAAVDTLVQKAVRAHTQVRDCVTTVVASGQSELAIRVQLSLLPDANIPEICAKVQSEVKEQIQAATGVSVKEVRVVVESTGVNPNARVS